MADIPLAPTVERPTLGAEKHQRAGGEEPLKKKNKAITTYKTSREFEYGLEKMGKNGPSHLGASLPWECPRSLTSAFLGTRSPSLTSHGQTF
ncbi:hypothetical protein B296_00019641 [Ensete ventricosum]|uniref:Uncharacterized protein n=1 Tax=Ensete ventricosum TaxID=4639 RepID=A0A426Z9F2_ENSVE|nr:hypothetical protein B296_00019641 [Ensete ventricosum]